jgi:hypothetical protein
MTAVTSFYLGANTAASVAATAAQAADTSKPTIVDVDPKTHSIAKGGNTLRLQVLGNNLNAVTHVKIQRAGVQVLGTEVASNPTRVTCKIDVTSDHVGDPWDVVVDDSAAKSATLRVALTITA